MKRIFATIFLFTALFIFIFLGLSNGTEQNEIRIHIAYNSTEISDESAGEIVAEKMKSFLLFSHFSIIDEAINYINKNLSNICGIANEILAQNNLDYKSSANLSCKYFGKQTINGRVFQAGNYHILFITLGEGLGESDYIVWDYKQTKRYDSRFF